ncbi:glycoside hydrolase family 43 protein [Streptomyces mirabilis]|uniref:glycoside hydrolase family 43 protein n=1 Tax=Streptomyces mirabilis TaxID=68239 RepID=UPI0036E98EEB
MEFTNPVIPGFYPDPSICRVGDDYYLVTSSFEYTPGVPVFHSRDLVHWRQIGSCLTRPSQLPLPLNVHSFGIFAPTIRHHDGTFYMITTNVDDKYGGSRGTGNFYVSTDDPAGEWSEPIWVEQGGIDPSLFFDDDGRVYLTSSYNPGVNHTDPNTTDPGWGIQQSEIDIATGKLLTEPRVIWSGTGGSDPEAPHLYKINGRYYLMIAEGGTEYGHMETLARSDTPWGPWETCPHNPILSHRSTFSAIQATGHADLVEAQDGTWWAVCLGIRPHLHSKLHHLGRETFLAPVTWDEDGWPHVGENGRIGLSMEGPNLPEVTWPQPAPRDDFDQAALGHDWNFLRWPRAEDWSLTARPGFLRLTGNSTRLDDGSGVAFVGRRQTDTMCEASTLLDFTPQEDGQEAGLTVWMNQSHHYDLAVTLLGGERRVIVRRRIGSLSAVVANEPIPDGPITLRVSSAMELGTAAPPFPIPTYTFSYALADDRPRKLATGEARHLASEIAGGCTGAYLALYATTNGAQTSVPADYDWFEYRCGSSART